MGTASGLAVFLMIWWTALFLVLPWGIHTDSASGQVGAPRVPHLKRKFIATTLISALVWLAIEWAVLTPDLLSFREMARQMPM
jgi:predicted secreted protein